MPPATWSRSASREKRQRLSTSQHFATHSQHTPSAAVNGAPEGEMSPYAPRLLLQTIHSPRESFSHTHALTLLFWFRLKHLWALTNSYHRSVHLTISWETFRGVAWGAGEGEAWKDRELHGDTLGFGPSSFLSPGWTPHNTAQEIHYMYI